MTSVRFNWNRSGGEIPGMDIVWLVVGLAVAVGAGLAFLLLFLTSCTKPPAAPNPFAAIPPDVPMYTRATMIDLRSSDLGFQAVLETSSNVEEIEAWYKANLPAKGWTWLGRTPTTAPGDPFLITARKDQMYLTLSVRDSGEGKKRQVVVNYMKSL